MWCFIALFRYSLLDYWIHMYLITILTVDRVIKVLFIFMYSILIVEGFINDLVLRSLNLSYLSWSYAL